MRVNGLEIVTGVGIFNVTTSGTGGNWVQLPAGKANQVVLYNQTGTAIRARYCDTSGNAIAGQQWLVIPDQTAQPLRGIRDSSQVQVQRNDLSGTQVILAYVAEWA